MSPEFASNMGLSRHARARAQERSIPALIIQLLMSCGTEVPAVGGAGKLFFDRNAKQRVQKLMGGKRGARTIERWFNTCAILGSDGSIVTLYRE